MYFEEKLDDYWNNYWVSVQHDKEMRDETSYPIYPLNQYIKPTDKILECGCGLGRVVKYFKKNKLVCVGMDNNWYCMDALKKEDGSLSLVQADCRRLPFKEGYFDVVTSFGTYSCIQSGINESLKEARWLLKKGGLLCISMPYMSLPNLLSYSEFGFKVRSNNFIRKEFRKKKINKDKHFFGNMFNIRELNNVFLNNGFKMIKTSPVLPEQGFSNLFPFFRKTIGSNNINARTSDSFYQFNDLGQGFLNIIKKYMPYIFSIGVYCIVEKE